MRKYILYLTYTDKYKKEGLHILQSFVSNLFDASYQNYLIIDNAIEKTTNIRYAENINLISGDNSYREFSGLQKGIKVLQETQELENSDIFILANDTFYNSYGIKYLEYFQQKECVYALIENKVIGYINNYPLEIKVFNLPLRSWIRSSLIILNYETLKKLLPLIIPYKEIDLFSEDYHEFFNKNINISENYKGYLRTWLFGETNLDTNFQQTWHSQKPLTLENFQSFKGKTMSIFCEHYLSARIVKNNIDVYGVNSNFSQNTF